MCDFIFSNTKLCCILISLLEINCCIFPLYLNLPPFKNFSFGSFIFCASTYLQLCVQRRGQAEECKLVWDIFQFSYKYSYFHIYLFLSYILIFKLGAIFCLYLQLCIQRRQEAWDCKWVGDIFDIFVLIFSYLYVYISCHDSILGAIFCLYLQSCVQRRREAGECKWVGDIWYISTFFHLPPESHILNNSNIFSWMLIIDIFSIE